MGYPAQLVRQISKSGSVNFAACCLPQNEVVMGQPANGAAGQHQQLFGRGAGDGAGYVPEHHHFIGPVL